MKSLFCFILIFLSGFVVSHVTIVGPRSICFQEDLKLYLINTERSDDEISIILVGKSSSEELYTDPDSFKLDFNEKLVEITGLTDHKIFEDFTLKVTIKNKYSQSIDISTSLQKHSLIIQSDRGSYKPGDEIKFRTLLLDSLTKPYQSRDSLSLNISDAKGNVVFQTDSAHLESPFVGVHIGHYKMNELQPQGAWEIRAQLGVSVAAAKTIEVSEIILPRFRVIIESTSNILLHNNNKLKITVFGEYSFGEFVKGEVAVIVKAYSLDEPMRLIKQKTVTAELSAKKTLDFDLINELALETSCNLVVDVAIQEKVTNKVAKATKNVTVHERPEHKVELISLDEVKPGSSLELRALVKKYDETVESSKGYRLKFTINAPSGATIVEKNLVNGIADLTVKFPLSNKGLKVTARYLDSTASINIQKISTSHKYLVIKVDKRSPKLGENLKIQVESSEPISTLFTAVSKRTETFHEKIVSSSVSRTFIHDLKVTQDMSPSFDIIAYYVDVESGKVVFDRLPVKVPNQLINNLKVDFNLMQVKPRENATIAITTLPNAFVGLMAVDNDFGKANDDIDQEKIFKLFFGDNELNTIKRTSNQFDFGNSNLFLITSFTRTANRFGTFDYDEGDKMTKVASKPVQQETRKGNFQETWFFESVTVDQTGRQSLTKLVPDTITSWTMMGFSLDTMHGLAISDPKKLYVKKDFFIKHSAPRSIRLGEVLKLEVFVNNYLPSGPSEAVTVTLSKNEILDYFIDDAEDLETSEFDIVQKVSKCVFTAVESGQKSHTVNANHTVSSTFFYIKPKTAGVLKFLITAASKEAKDDIEVALLVEYEGVSAVESKSFLIEPSRESFSTLYEISLSDDANEHSVKVGGSVHYKLLGLKLLKVDSLLQISNKTKEHTLASFSASVAAARYLLGVKQFWGSQKTKADQEIKKGYRQVQDMEQRDGSYRLSRFDNSNTVWLTACVAKILGIASDFHEVDSDLIEAALRYLSRKQGTEGGFESDSDTPRVIQGGVSSKISLTAFVLIAFLENHEIATEDFPQTVVKGVKYLEENVFHIRDNYETAIVAYAFALANHTTAKIILRNLKENAEKEDDKMYWYRNFDGNEKEGEFLDHAVNVETAAYALLAFLKSEEYLTALNIMNWLITQKINNGGFYSTQDTAIGIQALAQISEVFYSPGINMNIKLQYDIPGEMNFNANLTTILSKSVFDLPSRSRKFHITASGNGKALLNIWHSYKTHKKTTTVAYGLDISIQTAKYQGIFYFNACLDSDTMHMMRLDVGLPSGYVYDHDSTASLKTKDVKKVEAPANSDVVTLYFNRIEYGVCIDFAVIRERIVENLMNSPVKFYNVNEPAKQTIKYYSLKGDQLCNI